jgi:hypothetical protein
MGASRSARRIFDPFRLLTIKSVKLAGRHFQSGSPIISGWRERVNPTARTLCILLVI